MNIFEIAYDAFKPFLDGEKRQLNVMEVTNLWFYLTATENTLRNEEVGHNIAQDQELKELLYEAKVSIHEPIAKELRDFLVKEGVPLPQETPSKSFGDFPTIPKDAKLDDEEIANLMSFNLLLGITYAARGLTESLRADVAFMFMKFLTRKTTFGLKLKPLMEKRGWLRVPPYYKKE